LPAKVFIHVPHFSLRPRLLLQPPVG
jgi:hypothetical protein